MTLAAALALAEDGWEVFPVGQDRKPRLKWREAATSDPAAITELWRKHPGSWPAIALPPEVLVIDVDPKNGGRAPDGMPPTLSVTTRSGGRHYYYALPDGTEAGNLVGLIQGVDSRTYGGYVVAPGAPGYSWDNDLPCAEAPGWLVELCQKRTVDAPTDAVIGELPAETQRERLPQLVAMFSEAWRDGQKHFCALAIAGYMHKAGYAWESVESVIRQLPSAATEDRIQDAKDAWLRGDQAAGFKWLSEHLPEVWHTALDTLAHSVEPSPLDGLREVVTSELPASLRPTAFLTLEDVLAEIPESSEVRYFQTGVAPLDAALMSGNGLYAGRPVIFAGAPEAAKTQLIYQIADHFACQGVAVLHVAVDEAPEELVAREIATWNPGVSRVDAATPGPALRDAVRERRKAEHRAPYYYQREGRLDAAFLKVPELRKQAPSGVAAIIVDSIHKVDAGVGRDEYERIEATCAAIRIAMQDSRFRCLFVATAELARSAYEDKGKDDIGAAAGHRALEFLPAVSAVLRRNPDAGPFGGTTLKITKNKLGPLARFDLCRATADCPLLAPRGDNGQPLMTTRDRVMWAILKALADRPAQRDEGGTMPTTARTVLAQRAFNLNASIRSSDLTRALNRMQMANEVWIAPNGSAIQITAAGADRLRQMEDPLVNAGPAEWPISTPFA